MCLLLLALLAALICRLVRLWELENMDVRGMFGKIRKAVRFAGFPEQYGDSEERWILHLPEIIPGLTDSQARSFLRILQEASFGKGPVGKEREEEARGIYRQIAEALYRRLPFWKKPVFKYVKTFL